MKTVLIIDDDELYQLVLKRTIRKVAPETNIVSCWNGEEALDTFATMFMDNTPLPDVVFLDINMPVLDGWQFLDGLEKIKPNAGELFSIYMISTSLDFTDRQKATKSHTIKKFLTKPLEKHTLEEILC